MQEEFGLTGSHIYDGKRILGCCSLNKKKEPKGDEVCLNAKQNRAKIFACDYVSFARRNARNIPGPVP